MNKCLRPTDSREVLSWGRENYTTSVCIYSEKNIVAFGFKSSELIEVWSMKEFVKIHTLRGACLHSGSTTCLTISTDGKTLVSGSSDGTVRRWDLESGLTKGEAFEVHNFVLPWVKYHVVNCVSISNNGKTIVSAMDDGSLRRWDSESGLSMVEALEGHTKMLNSVAISKDGKTIVSGSYDGTVRRWETESGLSIGEPLEGHTDCVFSVAISNDGKTMVSGSIEKTVRLWDAKSGLGKCEPLLGHTARSSVLE